MRERGAEQAPPGSLSAGVLAKQSPSPWRRRARRQPLDLGGAVEAGFGARGCGSQHPTAPTANPSRARDASTRPRLSPTQPSRAARRAPANHENAGRLATMQGGAPGRPGLGETSASGAAAIAPLGSSCPYGCTGVRAPAPRVPELRLLPASSASHVGAPELAAHPDGLQGPEAG